MSHPLFVDQDRIECRPMEPLSDDFSEYEINLKRLLWVRMTILPVVLLAIWLADHYLVPALPLGAMVAALLIMLLISALAMYRLHHLRHTKSVVSAELFSQVVMDVLFLTALLYFSGGATNPFAPAYLLPLAMTAVILPGIHVWLIYALSAACYTLLLFFYVPVVTAHSPGLQWHIWGMWAGFLFSAGIVAGFATRVAATVRARDDMIAKMRDQQARQQQVLALGTLAAGAAHDLGTPLSTMAVLVKDMRENQPTVLADITTLTDQLKRCQTILSSMSATAGGFRPESVGSISADQYIRKLIKNWQQTRPDLLVELLVDGPEPVPQIMSDRTLDQAIVNVLNNAGDASKEIEVKALWADDYFDLKVLDQGPGIANELVDAAGKILVSTKQEGLGVGLYLSYTTLERLGGEIRLYNREKGGVCCHILLPLLPLKVA